MSAFYVFHEGYRKVWQLGSVNLRLDAESTSYIYNYCETIIDLTVVKWYIMRYGILLLWKLRREGCQLVRLSGGPGGIIKHKSLGNSKCEDFAKPRWGRKMQRTACARRLGAEGELENWVE